jgi:hypothetical protein
MTKKEKIEFRIKSDDYFGNLAAVLDLLSQDLERLGYQKQKDILVGLKEELLYLQEGYRIVKSEKPG